MKVDRSGKRLDRPGLCDPSESGIRPIDLLLLDLFWKALHDLEYRLSGYFLGRRFMGSRRTAWRFVLLFWLLVCTGFAL